MTATQPSAGYRACVFSILNDHLAVHYHVVNTHGVVLGIVFTGVGFDSLRVKDDYVSLEAVPEQAPVRET